MHDESLLGIQVACRVQALHKTTFPFYASQRPGTHACHELHIGDDVGTVGDLHAATGIGRVDRTHAIGNDVHRPAFHCPFEQCIDFCVSLGRAHPVVVRAGVLRPLGADEGQVLDASNIRWVRQMQVAVPVFVLIERRHRAVGYHRVDQLLVFIVAAVTPVNLFGQRTRGDFVHPFLEGRKACRH